MNLKRLSEWFIHRLYNYNLFIGDEAEDDGNDRKKDPGLVVKRQIYATRLYVILLIVSFYVLIITTTVNSQSRTITISNISPSLFKQLYLEHPETLSCSCSNTNIPYNTFVTNIVSYHPICSSFFVSQQWINALYLPNSSVYLPMDFRTTAYAQFELLATLCSISKKTISELLTDFGNDQLVTIQLLTEDQLKPQVNASVQLVRDNAPVQIMSPFTYLRIITQASSLVTAFNLNNVIVTGGDAKGDEYSAYNLIIYYVNHFLSGCRSFNPINPAVFSPISYGKRGVIYPFMPDLSALNLSGIVNGFFAGCTPLEGLLASTLDCLYNVSCLKQLPTYFPELKQMNINWSDIVLSEHQQNISLNNHFTNLFINTWLTMTDYLKYFDKCAASYCTYTTKESTNLLYAVTLLCSLYGGLIIILRLISFYSVTIFLKLRHRLANRNLNSEQHVTYIQEFLLWIKELNLFKSKNDRSEVDIKRQFITTRVYLTLLSNSFLVLLLFNLINVQTTTITVANPSLNDYKQLYNTYTNTLKCTCSNMEVHYSTITSLSPTFHQVCSSGFVSDQWISKLNIDFLLSHPIDWIVGASAQFPLLSNLCELAETTVSDSVKRFLAQSLITSNLLTENEFSTQLNATISQFLYSTNIRYHQLVDTIRLLIHVDQPLIAPTHVAARNGFNARLQLIFKTNQTAPQLTLVLSGTPVYDSPWIETNKIDDLTTTDCICATNLYCQKPSAIYYMQYLYNELLFISNYKVPGAVTGCFAIDSLLFSTLECFYSNSDCLQILFDHIRYLWLTEYGQLDSFVPQPLVYDNGSSRFPPNTSLSTIVKELMIEYWNISSSYHAYYQACAPTYCTYSIETRPKSPAEIVTTIISMIGGLTVGLRLITGLIIKLIFYLTKRSAQRQEQVRSSLLTRLKRLFSKIFMSSHKMLTKLNIFPRRVFSNQIEQMTFQRLGQWSTRLYIFLLTISLCIILFYNMIRPQTLTRTFQKPSIDTYNKLIRDHSDTLQCPCSFISTQYDQFMKIEAVFHQVCSSSFISDDWQRNITAGLVADLSAYTLTDYRRFFLAHFQFLTGLCELSTQAINDSINQFLSSLWVSSQLLSETTFHQRIDSLIEQNQLDAPKSIARLLNVIRSTNNGNHFISAYGTNFQYIPNAYRTTYRLSRIEPVIYDNNCSCGLNASCTTEARFFNMDSSGNVSLKGLKVGCTPVESFLLSTLECLYDSSCINLIYQYMNYNNTDNHTTPLSTPMNRFSINSTIAGLIENLFVEKWSTSVNYSLYFKECLPYLCSYTYVQQIKSVYTITLLLGVYGGLTVVLKLISPIIVRLIFKVSHYRRMRRNIITPISTIEIPINETTIASPSVRTIDHRPTRDTEPIPKAPTHLTNASESFRITRNMVFTFIFVMLLVTAMIIFSVYTIREGKRDSRLTVILTNTTTETISTTTSITDMPMTTTASISSTTTLTSTCQLFMEVVTLDSMYNDPGAGSVAVEDVNKDGLPDIIVADRLTSAVLIIVGSDDGSFTMSTMLSTGDGSEPRAVITIDLNADNYPDIVVANTANDNVGVFLGYGDGSFGEQMIFSTGDGSFPFSIAVGYINNDDFLDIVVGNNGKNNVGVLFGYGNGFFDTVVILPLGDDTHPFSIVLADFNHDNQSDIAVANNWNSSISVLLGYGNGSFTTPMTYSTGVRSFPLSITVSDLNNDSYLDIISANSGSHNVAILFGYGNGTFQTPLISSTYINWPSSITVADIDNDKTPEIVVVSCVPAYLYILPVFGNGSFGTQTYFTDLTLYSPFSVVVNDLNGDGCLDIIYGGVSNVFVQLNTCQSCIH